MTAPMSHTMTGVYVGNTPASVTAYEDWFARDVDSVLVFTSENYWENWQSTLGWLKGGAVFGSVDRPLVWSIPLFPRDGSFAFAASPVREQRWQAEAAVLTGSARILNDTKATPPTTANVAYLPNTPGGIEFVNLPATNLLRLHYYATAPGKMTLFVNDAPAGTVNFAATKDPGNASNFIYQELRLDVAIPEGGSLRLQNDGGSVWKTDYLAIGNYAQRYREAALALANYRPQDAVVFVRPGWEFNGDWYPWSAGNGNAAAFAATFRTFVDEFRAVSPRFRFDWNPNFGTGVVDPEACYPGDAYVDVIGMDLYDSEKNTGIDNQATRWNFYVNHARGLEWMRRFAGEHNKLLALSEWGVSDHNLPDHAGETKVDDNPTFVRNLQQWMADNDTIYHHYWDSTSSYDGRLRDNVPLNTANEYVLAFSTPVPLSDGTPTPPSNTSDEFNKSVPRAQWRFVRHDPTRWSLAARPGAMRLLSTATELQGATNTAANLLLQTAPDRDFEIVTRLYGRPFTPGQQCGLIVYQDDDNYVKLVRQHDGGNRIVFARETAGAFASGGEADCLGDGPAYLKIERKGDKYRGYVSDDGRKWSHVWSKQTVALSQPRVGLIAFGADGLAADFDTFFVNKLEAEHGRLAGTAEVDVSEDPALSGSKFVTGLNTPGAAISWLNVPGGAGLRIRYRATAAGRQGLYVDGVRVRDVNFAATDSSGEFGTVEVERTIPAGATLALQCDAGDTAWSVDEVSLVHQPRFEAEEATREGVTRREADARASQECAIRVDGAAAGGVCFPNLGEVKHATVRYLAEAAGTMAVYVNGVLKANVTLAATPSPTESGKFVFADRELPVKLPAGASLTLRTDSGGSWAVDYVTVK